MAEPLASMRTHISWLSLGFACLSICAAMGLLALLGRMHD
jgi:hypothetical protein